MKKRTKQPASETARRKNGTPSATKPIRVEPELYRRAETELRKQRKRQPAKRKTPHSETDSRRLLHELQVHEVELEMQITELRKTREELEVALEKYTDLYDFAPVGYFSVDESGTILEANLTGAVMVGVERSRLINRRLPQLVAPESLPACANFLQQVFHADGDRVCEVQLLHRGKEPFWAGFQAAPAISNPGSPRWCRVAFTNITSRKVAEETRRHAETLDVRNRVLQQEVARREVIERALKRSRTQQARLLERAREMQRELRHLSRKVLHAQEEERRKISRELHDVIAQTLAGISVRLAALQQDPSPDPRRLTRHIARTQQQVERSVKIVQRFARDLRPAMLDDLGLVPALHAFLNDFTTKTGVRVELNAFEEADELDTDRRTVLFRVAQETLNNVAQHARAARVRVDVRRMSDHICLKIADDGTSFDVDRVPPPRGRRHLGLIGMRERVEMIGGQLVIRSKPGTGTTIEARIPLRGSRRARATNTNGSKKTTKVNDS